MTTVAVSQIRMCIQLPSKACLHQFVILCQREFCICNLSCTCLSDQYTGAHCKSKADVTGQAFDSLCPVFLLPGPVCAPRGKGGPSSADTVNFCHPLQVFTMRTNVCCLHKLVVHPGQTLAACLLLRCWHGKYQPAGCIAIALDLPSASQHTCRWLHSPEPGHVVSRLWLVAPVFSLANAVQTFPFCDQTFDSSRIQLALKSVYTHLHFCGLELCCASQTDI